MKRRFFEMLLLLTVAAPVFALGQTVTNRSQAYYHFTQARMLEDQGQYEQAIQEYNKALEFDPNNSLIYSEMAQTYASNRRLREAVETAQKAIQIDRNNIEAHKLLSQIYVQQIGNSNAQQPPSASLLNSAIGEFEEIVRIDPTERQGYLMLGRLYQIKGDRTKAAEVYTKYLGIEPGSEEGVISLAKLHMEAGNNKEAIEILEKFIEQAPDSDRGLEALGEAYVELEEFDKAAGAYKRAYELDPENIELKKSLAQALFFTDKFTESAALYEELLKAEPNDGMAMLRLGQIYRRQTKFREARQYLTRAAQAFPDSMEVQFNLVLLDRDEGLIEDALKRTTDILKKTERPNDRYSESEKQNRRVFLTHIGMLNSILGRYDAAIQAFTQLKAISPEKDERVDALIIDAFRSAKDLDKAIAHSEQALAEVPDSRALQMLHADLIAEKGRVAEAIQALQKMSGGTDEDLAVLSSMVNIYQRAKKYNEAQSVVNTALQRFPNNYQVHFLQGSLYEQQKKYADAEKSFRKALELDKDNPAVLNYLGYMLADRNEKLQEALGFIKKAVESEPSNGAYLDSLGWAYYRLNQLDLAEQYLKKAVIFSGSDATLHDHLGEVFYKTRRYEEAQAAWTKSFQLATDPEEKDRIKKKLDEVKTRVAKK